MRNQRGFTLIELLIVVAIVLILAAVAIPNLLQARMSANECSAVASLRTYNSAQSTYQSTYSANGYASSFTALGPPAEGSEASSTAAGLVDNVLGCAQSTCMKAGYNFVLSAAGTPPTAFSIQANPLSLGSTGNRFFYTDNSFVIRVNTSTYAGPKDSVLSN
jgi:prepilin-type N-terminal cleavage/methylation domain-containing protein